MNEVPTGTPPEPLSTAAQYIGINAARAVATSVGWSRSQTIILIQVPLIAAIATFIAVTKPSGQPFRLMVAGCIAGLIANVTWLAIIKRTGTWVEFFNERLADIELISTDAPVPIFSSEKFDQTAARWGAGKTLYLFASIGSVLWVIMLWYIINGQYPGFLGEALEQGIGLIQKFMRRR